MSSVATTSADDQQYGAVTGDPLLWVDIENPPQVQYLLPIVSAARSCGARTVITARDYGETFALLDASGEAYQRVGAAYGASRFAKARGVLRRVRALARALNPDRPDVLVCASRAAAVTARVQRIPSFVILDYEFVDAAVFRVAGSTILFPDVIDPEVLRRRGIPSRRLVPFKGLKEDLTFSGMRLEDVPAADLGAGSADAVRILVRPAAEESHYFRPESRVLVARLLEFLASRDVQVVFSPRYPRQVRDVEGIAWRHPPVVLTRPLAFVSLLKAVDAVVCSGGTMLREAAYLGIPAYSIFQSELGAVDRHLEAVGRVCLIRSVDELDRIGIERRTEPLAPLHTNNRLPEHIVRHVLAAAGVGGVPVGRAH